MQYNIITLSLHQWHTISKILFSTITKIKEHVLFKSEPKAVIHQPQTAFTSR